MRSNGFMRGRGLLIILAIVVSGASFALGFFVGKFTDTSGVGVMEVASSTSEVPEEEVRDEGFAGLKANDRKAEEPAATPAPEKNKTPQVPVSSGKKVNNGHWAVQTGAYKTEADARGYLKGLEASGYKVYIVRHEGLYKVRVGEFDDKQDAQAALGKLKSGGTEGFIVRN